ncbi:hypothetical protein V12B01_12895 [Vibrio splendidus 12B01]|nr:hypothetical protein V12B01_12895 [Vibrio splendidus 12B01]
MNTSKPSSAIQSRANRVASNKVATP